jgi:ribosome biogenesis GTPase A
VKDGGPDVARAATALLNDFRSGALGRITLEAVDESPAPGDEATP